MKRVVSPLSEDTVRSLAAGEEVLLSGPVLTARDEAHMRALEMHERGEPLPFDLQGIAVYHCGPIMVREADGWRLVAAGPTTSSRMNTIEPAFIKAFGIRAIIGKGGMSRSTVEAMKEQGCVYLAFTGGAAIIASKGITKVESVDWLDLGMPEAVWHLQANDFGPLIVAIDSHGRSLYDEIDERVRVNLEGIRKDLGL
ncbi:MAG TPA: FumA C-terminus/TtdB family hydratase beta subunit [Methanomassiliicoccales archaeon]